MPFDRPSGNCIHVFRHMPGPASVMTVSGPIAADRLGFTLIHEHLLLDLMRDAWIGNNILNDPELALIELQRYKQAGGVTLVDQTNRGLAQDPLGLDQLDILREEGVDPRRVVVGHAQSYPVFEYHAEIARRGAFISFDRMGATNPYDLQKNLQLVRAVLEAGLEQHLVLSHDVC